VYLCIHCIYIRVGQKSKSPSFCYRTASNIDRFLADRTARCLKLPTPQIFRIVFLTYQNFQRSTIGYLSKSCFALLRMKSSTNFFSNLTTFGHILLRMCRNLYMNKNTENRPIFDGVVIQNGCLFLTTYIGLCVQYNMFILFIDQPDICVAMD